MKKFFKLGELLSIADGDERALRILLNERTSAVLDVDETDLDKTVTIMQVLSLGSFDYNDGLARRVAEVLADYLK